nr:tryptophan halogenase family protein [Sphingomonas aerophila]
MRHVVILGGGSAGWMAAAALSRFLPATSRVTLVESDDIGTVGVGEATIPQIRLFNSSLGVEEGAFLATTQGTIKLGIEFVGWTGPDSRYTHAFGAIGRGLGLLPFHHYWLRQQTGSLWDYSVAAAAAKAGRFAPDPGRPELPTGLTWAYQFDAGLYAGLLRGQAEARRVTRVEGEVATVTRDPLSGDVTALVLNDGRQIAGDFFIDCSGFRGLLVGEAMGVPFDDWSRWLPCDRALAVPSEAIRPILPLTRATARTAGWQWRIPLRHRTGNGLVFCSAYLNEDAATAELLRGLDAPALAEPRLLRFTTGRRTDAWAGNCVALGLASGFLEPLESTSLHLVQSGIARLLQFWPGERIAPADRDAFNRETAREWASIRDFLVLHYHANARAEPFWQACRAVPLPDQLAAKLDLFRAHGRIVREGDELFTEVGWLQVMLGQGVLPASYHPLADAPSAEDLASFLDAQRRHVSAVVGRMPSHEQFLRTETRDLS